MIIQYDNEVICMNEIKRLVKIKEVNGVLNCSIPKEIQEHMDISKGEMFEIVFSNSNPDRLSLIKFDLENNNIWLIIGDRYNWSGQIKAGNWGLENDKSHDLKLFESIKPNDIILAYYKSPQKSIKHILMTKQGFNFENGTIDIHNVHNIEYPITYDDFNNLNIMNDYRKMNRRSAVPVLPEDWEIIKNDIFTKENIDVEMKIADSLLKLKLPNHNHL